MSECTPVREGDRWVCNRSSGRGGSCEDETPGGGPTPDGQCCLVKRCRPRRTLRAVRGRWARGALVFVVGATLMLLGARARNDLMKPGPLSSHHAQVLLGVNATDRCTACHPAAPGDAGGLLQVALGLGEKPPVSQPQSCLTCHQELLQNGAEPLLAHGLRVGVLASPTNGLPANGVTAASLPTPPRGSSHDDPVACAVCHQEHHGADHNLSAITDARCQACHQEQYDGFAGSHPDFTDWPTERRTRIVFNHASHQGEHFAKASRSFDCRGCHTPDATGDLTARPAYAVACASCHDDAIHKSFETGVALVTLPSIDIEALATRNAAPQAWPAPALGDFDGDIPPLMRLLLASDPLASVALAELGPDATFFDIDVTDDATVGAGARLIDGLQTLLNELQDEGHQSLEYRLRTLLGDEVRPIHEYVARLPVELVDELQAVWFGSRAPPTPYDAIEDRRTGGGWRLDHERLSLDYRPTGHDDPMMRAWIDLAVSLPDEHAAIRDVVLAEFRRPGAPGGCLDCHSVEQSAEGMVVNWRGRDRLVEPRGFTHFSHRPHLTQPQLADCTHCHAIELDSGSGTDTGPYGSLDPHTLTSEFATLRKSSCTACHRPHAAGDSCTQCHNYHVSPLAAEPRPADGVELEALREALRRLPATR
ncbi:MAG: hypothetical protein AAFV43_16400 [Planctomycetota bacterium]